MISIKTVLVALCVSLGVSRGDVLSDVDRVLENLILQRSQPNSYGSEEASTFDLEEFLDHGNQFKDFVREYERQYDSDSEIERRFDIFRNNLKTIDYYTKHEQGTATYGVNRFADMTDSEFNHGLSSLDWEQIENLKSTFETYSFNSSNSYGLAESINYKDKGKVLPKVQDQHLCGSCWAHSAVACLESAYAIKHNELIELSKQQLVDCDFLDGGCCGGWPFRAYYYLDHVGGIMEEKDYRQRIYEGPCQFDQKKAKVKVDKRYTIATNVDPISNEVVYAKYLNDIGPLVAIINADGFRFYKGGVMNLPHMLCSKGPYSLNHAVLNVGYDNEILNGEKFPYWIIKNSWGPKWGENGYIRVAKGVNTCGVGWIASGVTAL